MFVQRRIAIPRRPASAGLPLTSMIDVLTAIVLFLLMGFRASGECGCLRAIQLPSAVNTADMIDAPMVMVSGRQILVDGVPAGDATAILDAKRVQRVDELFGVLRSKRELFMQIHPGKDFPSVVVLEIDQDVQAVVVKSIFQTAAFAGYRNESFMVNALAVTARRTPGSGLYEAGPLL
jgi:hypothetical protein